MVRRPLTLLLIGVQLLPGLTVVHAHEAASSDGPEPSSREFHFHFVPVGCSHHHHHHHHDHHHSHQTDDDHDGDKNGDNQDSRSRDREPTAPNEPDDRREPAVSYAPLGCGVNAGAVLSRDLTGDLYDALQRLMTVAVAFSSCEQSHFMASTPPAWGMLCALRPRIALSLHLLI